ncbi:hypothetical protein LIER_07466 [Lithospermum erythrorhizon]|uniref:Uncharacterized protein n=1 Tax=Lithospermum erythrorhizon TaxID=34254 RepID=A0AAV3P8X3_LITER
MELKTIKDAFDRLTKNQKLSSSKSQELIEQISHEIEQAVSRINSVNETASPNDRKFILSDLNNKLKGISPVSRLESTQKELKIALTKYPTLLEKSFISDISKGYRNVDFDIHSVNQIIASHFYREGQFEIGDCFIAETGEMEAGAQESLFSEMYQILEAVMSHNLEPALRWASCNHEQLKQNGSDLELKLHRLQFLDISRKGRRDEALNYIRMFLAPFADSYMTEIQKLMASLLWMGRLDVSPYSDLLSPVHWDKLAEEVTCQFCNLLGHSCHSPLSVTIAAGVQGLPTLLKLMTVMTGKKHEWQTMKQLPVPLDLDKEFHFHSIFVCPVSREQASEVNPPMLLSCGHVLCKQSIAKLSKNNSTRPFKCPYCPFEVEVGQCRQLYL